MTKVSYLKLSKLNISSTKDLANEICNLFTNIGTTYANEIPKPKFDCLFST